LEEKHLEVLQAIEKKDIYFKLNLDNMPMQFKNNLINLEKLNLSIYNSEQSFSLINLYNNLSDDTTPLISNLPKFHAWRWVRQKQAIHTIREMDERFLKKQIEDISQFQIIHLYNGVITEQETKDLVKRIEDYIKMKPWDYYIKIIKLLTEELKDPVSKKPKRPLSYPISTKSTKIEETKTTTKEPHGPFLRVQGSVLITLQGEKKTKYLITENKYEKWNKLKGNSLLIEWKSNPVNDMITDSLIAMFMSLQANPSLGTAKLLSPAEGHDHNLGKHETEPNSGAPNLKWFLSQHFGTVKEIGDEYRLSVGNTVATIDIKTKQVTCEDDGVKKRILDCIERTTSASIRIPPPKALVRSSTRDKSKKQKTLHIGNGK